MGDDDDDQGSADAGGMNVVKYNVMPSLVSLMQMRNRLHLAFLGKKLMKWTALATGKELRKLSIEMGGLLTGYVEEFKEAYLMLGRCRYFISTFNTIILEGVGPDAHITVTSSARSVAGVKVKTLALLEETDETYVYVGIGRGGEMVRETRELWLKLLRTMVLLAQFRVTFELIDTANKNATKKQNVLQRCIIPKIILTMRYIMSELDEQEREESFRLKRFKQLKYKNVAPPRVPEEVPEEIVEPPVIEVPPPVIVPPPPAIVPPPPAVVPPPPAEVPPPPATVPPPPATVPPPPEIVKPPPVKVKPSPVKVLPPPAKVVVPTEKKVPVQEVKKKIEKPEPKEDLITQIKKVVQLAEQLDLAGIPPTSYGFTNCDVERLKMELRRIIELHAQTPKEKLCLACEDVGRIVSTCVCDEENDKPTIDSAKIKPVDSAQKTKPKPNVQPGTTASDKALKPKSVRDSEQSSIPTRLDELEKHIDKVICMTHFYQSEGLLSKSAEDFLKCCRSVKQRIQEFKDKKILTAKLDILKEQVTNLENITEIAQKEVLSTTSIGSFVSCCKEFKATLDRHKSSKGAPSVCSVEKLLGQIDDSIVLCKEAKKEGLVSESIAQFIESCKEIKSKIEPSNEQNSQVIDNLLFKVKHIIDFISKYKTDGLISESIEKFYNTCQNTKAKLEGYKECYKRPALSCNKSTSCKTVPITAPPKSFIPCTCGHSSSGYSCGTRPLPVGQSSETPCGSFPTKEQIILEPENPCKAICSINYRPSCPVCIHAQPQSQGSPMSKSTPHSVPSLDKKVCGLSLANEKFLIEDSCKTISTKGSISSCTSYQKSTSQKFQDCCQTKSSKGSILSCTCYQKSSSQKSQDSCKSKSSQDSNRSCASTCKHKSEERKPKASKESTFSCTCFLKSVTQDSEGCCKSKSCPNFKPVKKSCHDTTSKSMSSASSRKHAEKKSQGSCSAKSSQDSAATCTASTCMHKPASQEPEHTCILPGVDKTCFSTREKSKSHDFSKSKNSQDCTSKSICSASDPNHAENKSQGSCSAKSSQDSAATCTASTCMHKPASQEPEHTCIFKSCSLPKPGVDKTCFSTREKSKSHDFSKSKTSQDCTSKSISSANDPKHAEKKSQGSCSAKSSQDSAATCTASTCMHKPASQKPEAVDKMSYSKREKPKPYDCSKSISPSESLSTRTTPPKPAVDKTCFSKRAKPKSHDCSKSISLSESLSSRKTPSVCRSTAKQPSNRMNMSVSNESCACKKSQSNNSIKIIVPTGETKPKKDYLLKTVSTMTSVRRYKEKDGKIIEETETVTLKQRVIDPQKVLSLTSSYGSSESAKSTMNVNLCKIPMTKGFIQTMRNVKSETLIRSLDLSYSPIGWSSKSADKTFGRRSHANQTGQPDTFVCASLTSSDDDSE